MTYGLRQMVLGPRRFVELRVDEYQRARAARQLLLDVMHIEQKFRLLLMNYAEFEEQLLRLTNRQLVFHQFNWGSLHDDLFDISRSLINLLTTARLYTDQVQHDISDMYGKTSPQFKMAEEAFHVQYDALLGYRVMEALRNFVQHRGLPLHGIRYDRRMANSKNGDQNSHGCTPHISVKEFEKEGGFKAETLKQLRDVAETPDLDIKPFVREYMTGLGNAHQSIRAFFEADVKEAEEVFAQTYQKFVVVHGELPGIALVEENPDQISTVPTLYLVPDVIRRRKELTVTVANFRQMFVTSQAAEDSLKWVQPAKQELREE